MRIIRSSSKHNPRFGMWQTSPPYKNLVPRFGSLGKERWVVHTQTIFPFPSSFILGMIRPLNFKELNGTIPRPSFSLFKDANRVLAVGQIFLNIDVFQRSFLGRNAKALLQMGHMEHIMYSLKCSGQFQLIGNSSFLLDDAVRPTYRGANLPLTPKRWCPFKGETLR